MWARYKPMIIKMVCAHRVTNEHWFGTNTRFLDLDEGKEEAKRQEKPMMVVIHHEHCEACRLFRPMIANSLLVQHMSQHFIMVGVEEESCPLEFRVDGNYTPRVIFLNPEGQIETEYYNRLGNPRYRYFYPNDRSVIRTMKDVLSKYPPICNGDNACYLHAVENNDGPPKLL